MSDTTPAPDLPIEPTPPTNTTGGALPASLVRTAVPFIVGLVVTWLLGQLGVDLDPTLVAPFVTASAGYLYYVGARFLEVFVSDKWGYVLGVRRTPLYTAPVVPRRL